MSKTRSSLGASRIKPYREKGKRKNSSPKVGKLVIVTKKLFAVTQSPCYVFSKVNI